MKKEVFLAISIGFVLGLVITFGIWTANNSLKKLPQQKPTPTPVVSTSETPKDVSTSPSSNTTPAPSTSTKGTLPLKITTPQDEDLLTKNTVKLSGTTTAGAAVSLVYETGETILQADTSGNFSTDITLEGGFNTITVTASNSKGETSTTTLTLTYTTQSI